ncbi:MAG: GFA family protein [Casimicrobiaceae bacterium]
MTAAAASEARGRCHCGRVRFVATFPSRFCCHCHCESCRRAHGAPFVTWIGFPASQVHVTQGADDLVAHESSPQTWRKFCRACGTKLFFESSRWAGETHVVLPAFDEPVDRMPEGHAFYDEHVAWIPWPREQEDLERAR